MALESARHARFSLLYEKASGSVTLTSLDQPTVEHPATYTFEDSSDTITFDNDQPGRVHSVHHHADNQAALDILSRAVFDKDYRLVCESIHEGAEVYGYEHQRGLVTVPYSNQRRLARIALHNLAEGASQEVTNLHQRLEATGA